MVNMNKKKGFLQGLKNGAIIGGLFIGFGFLMGMYDCACSMCNCEECMPGDAMSDFISIICSGYAALFFVGILLISGLIGLLYGKFQEDQYNRIHGIETNKERRKREAQEKKNEKEQAEEAMMKSQMELFNERVWKPYNLVKNKQDKDIACYGLNFRPANIDDSVLISRKKFEMRISPLVESAFAMQDKQKSLYDNIMNNLNISTEVIEKYCRK